MTRKDFQLIADVFARTRPYSPSHEYDQWCMTRDAMNAALSTTNDRYNEAAFIAATED